MQFLASKTVNVQLNLSIADTLGRVRNSEVDLYTALCSGDSRQFPVPKEDIAPSIQCSIGYRLGDKSPR